MRPLAAAAAAVRHAQQVQENVIDLVGRIADRGAEYVPAREWMRICFELLDMLKAHKKAIRRATVNTFGYIAKAIGPQDVLVTLLNNLKVQERQNRVCTTVAIAIVAETCAPFTVLPALMNEYRVPELNVQNGVLKALSFMFEYIGEMGKDYVYAVAPLLQVRAPRGMRGLLACAVLRRLRLCVRCQLAMMPYAPLVALRPPARGAPASSPLACSLARATHSQLTSPPPPLPPPPLPPPPPHTHTLSPPLPPPGRAGRPRPGAPADGRHRGAAPRAGRARPGLRGRAHAPAQLRVAKRV